MQELYPLETNFKELYRIIGGFYPGELTCICGANIFGDEMAEFLFFLTKLISFNSKVPCALYTTNFMPRNIYYRFIASVTGIPWWKISDSGMDESEVAFVKNVTKQVYDLPMDINPMLSIEELCDEVRKFNKEKGVKIIYLEGIPFYNTYDINTSTNETESFVLKKLKQLAQELNVPIVVAAHLICRDVFNVSNAIFYFDKFQDSSVCGFHKLKMRVTKTHNGKLGTFDLRFNANILDCKISNIVRLEKQKNHKIFFPYHSLIV